MGQAGMAIDATVLADADRGLTPAPALALRNDRVVDWAEAAGVAGEVQHKAVALRAVGDGGQPALGSLQVETWGVEWAGASPEHLDPQPRRLGRSKHDDQVDGWEVETRGQNTIVDHSPVLASFVVR